jgi:hypothetical protein
MSTLILAKPADIQIPKLTTANYRIWKELSIAALSGRGVWEYAEGTIKEPDDEKEKLTWRQNNAVAMGIIKSALSEAQIGHVMGLSNAKAVWDKLKNVHESDNRARVKGLLTEFMKFRMDSTIEEGASKLSRLQSEIGILKDKAQPSDDIKIEVLLGSLGPEYDATLAGLDASSTATFEDIVAKLRRAETRIRGASGESQPKNLARLTQGPNQNGPRGAAKKKGACHYYSKARHYKAKCRKLLAEQGNRPSDTPGDRKTANGGHSAIATADNKPGKRAWAVHRARMVASKALQTDPWYLDSAATSHITNYRGLFIEYKQARDTVTVADGRELPTQGRGKVRVQLQGE